MSDVIYVIAEQSEGQLRKVSCEVASEAIRLVAARGGSAVGLTIGPGASEAGQQLGDVGIENVFAIEGDALSPYSGETYAQALADTIQKQGHAALVLMGASSWSRDLLGRVGVHLGVAPASDVIALDWQDDGIRLKRPVYAGKALLSLSSRSSPTVASLRGNLFRADEGKGASVNVTTVSPENVPASRAELIERKASEQTGRPDLSEADVVVSGGRGLKDPETFAQLIEPLADALKAAVGASRAVVDAGWRPHAEQVGQTGKTVAPKLYFACGISGAIQHLAGMRTSGTIVAINKDADAPIFKVADYGIVGKVEQVIPALTEQVKGLR
jgi:electron transfer flavoprotein alpha subunit